MSNWIQVDFMSQPRKLEGYGVDAIIRVQVRWHMILGNPGPYFSVCGEIFTREPHPGELSIRHDDKKWWLSSCGQVHESIRLAFPELRKYLRWHLCYEDGPTHFIENAVYFAQQFAGVAEFMAKGDTPERSQEHFCRHVVWGAVMDDVVLPEVFFRVRYENPSRTMADVVRKTIKEEITQWCHARRPYLVEALRADMEELPRILGGLRVE